MKNTIKKWAGIISSPSTGFATVNDATPFFLALIIILILTLASSALLLPVLGSDGYMNALSRAQINTLKERGTVMSEDQIEAMQKQLQSDSVRTITMVSATAGSVVTYVAMLFVSVLLMKLILLIFREKTSFKLLLRIMIFIALITAFQMIVKNLITVLTDYERVLSRVQYALDLQYALSSSVSLAALFSPAGMNPSLYYLLDAFTDIFNWLYYGYLYAGLRWAAGLNKSKALSVTIVSAIVMIGIGLIITLIV